MSSFFSSSRGRNIIVYIILLFLSFFLIVSSKSSLVLTFKEVNQGIFYPFRVVTRFAIHEFSSLFHLFAKKNDLNTEINNYKNEILQYQKQILNLQDLAHENAQLRNALSIKPRIQYDSILAEVVGVDPSYTFSYITVNKGRVDGVEKRLPVVSFINGQEVVVGIVSEASVFTSTVETIKSNNLDLGITLIDTNNQGVVEGVGGNSDIMQLLYIGKDTKLEVGQSVITSRLSSLFPPNIGVGSVTSIDTTNKTKISYQAYVKPYVSISKLSQVFILKTKVIPNTSEESEGENK